MNKKVAIGVLLVVLISVSFLVYTSFLHQPGDSVHPELALKRLVEGNDRFMQDKMLHCDKNAERREALIAKQAPFAIVVGCSDSRVSPEIIFDQGIGDLFVVRVAGNVVGPVELASIDYAATQLHSSLVIVLGHESCGAVKAVLEGKTKDIEAIAELIQTGLQETKENIDVAQAVKANVHHGLEVIKAAPPLAKLIAEKKLKAVGGYYNLQTGQVELID